MSEATDWEHGVFLGSIMSSETTAAAAGAVGKLRRDPMAMLPFLGYDMSAYFEHWIRAGQREGANLPRTFYVNWFRKDDSGRFLWPGFGENSRVLAWIFRRCDDEAEAVDTPIGGVPAPEALDTEGLDISGRGPASAPQRRSGGLEGRAALDPRALRHFGDRLPQALRDQLAALEQRLDRA